MYKFIKKLHEECKIDPLDIQALEKKFDIKFPSEMVDFYLQYNDAEIYLSEIETEEDKPQVFAFYPIRYRHSRYEGTIDETMLSFRQDGFFDPKMIPFAGDQGGDPYFCDSISGEIYLIRSDDIDEPIKICDSFNEFLSRLHVCDSDI